MNKDEWAAAGECMGHAFQPIVSVRTGACLGCEALLRGYEHVGVEHPWEVFDAAYADEALYALDLVLRERALTRFTEVPGHERMKLFYNLDGRLLRMSDYCPGNTVDIVRRLGIRPAALCFEFSERHDVDGPRMREVLSAYRRQGFRVALDDYGSGYSGLHLLYQSEPHFLKIDRFFVNDIATDHRKRLFVGSVVDMAHMLGIAVIAEGVENQRELEVCTEIGADYLQGWHIQKPTLDPSCILTSYASCVAVDRHERRRRVDRISATATYLEQAPTVRSGADMIDVLRPLRSGATGGFVVVVDAADEPVGIVRERDVRPYLYNPFGLALLTGPSRSGVLLREFVSTCPTADIDTEIDAVARLFSGAESAYEGVIVTAGGRYAGFVSAGRLLRAVHDRSVETARDQNPLTRLPGNNAIHDYLDTVLSDTGRAYTIAYLDFDGFKPFNDTYGFRRGDRALQMFADILRAAGGVDGLFIGHVGGDDFFAGVPVGERSFEDAHLIVEAIAEKFGRDARCLHSPVDRERGFMTAVDREGTTRAFPLLTVSAAVVRLPAGRAPTSVETLSARIARLKKDAKLSEGHVATDCLPSDVDDRVRAVSA